MLIQYLGSILYMLIIQPFHIIWSLFKRSPQKSAKMTPSPISFKGPRIKQPFEVFLVLDIEGTCDLGTDFNYPNEIIVRARMTFYKNTYFFLMIIPGIACLYAALEGQNGRWQGKCAGTC